MIIFCYLLLGKNILNKTFYLACSAENQYVDINWMNFYLSPLMQDLFIANDIFEKVYNQCFEKKFAQG